MTDNHKQVKKDVPNGGKDQLYLDVDRMINEGMAGGTVRFHGDYTNIEESRDLHPEEPPHIIE